MYVCAPKQELAYRGQRKTAHILLSQYLPYSLEKGTLTNPENLLFQAG